MEAVTYTIVAVLLYFFSDWILNQVEVRLGQRLKYRSLVFFAILATLALSSFALLRRFLA